MTKSFTYFPALILGVAALAQAQAPTKVAIIAVQQAILQTKDGQKATQDLQAKFNPRRTDLEQKQQKLASLQQQLKTGASTMSDTAKEKLAKDINGLNTDVSRGQEDFDADLQQEEQKIMNELGTKMMDVIIKYATQNGYSMVIDVSNQQTPVLWADQSVIITDAIIKLYDQAHPGAATAAPAAKPAGTTPKPASPTASAPRQTPPAAAAKK